MGGRRRTQATEEGFEPCFQVILCCLIRESLETDKALSPANVRDMAPSVFESAAKLRASLEQAILKSGGELETNVMKWTATAT